jgi:Holliday junction resolvase
MNKTNSLTRSIIQYLDMQGFEVWRQNTTGVYDPQKKIFRKNFAQRKGIPDIIGYRRLDGKFIAIEVKTGKDTLSFEQKMFLEDLRRSGGIALVIRTLEELLIQLSVFQLSITNDQLSEPKARNPP